MGKEQFRLGIIDDTKLSQYIQSSGEYFNSYGPSHPAWTSIWQNTRRCLGNHPSDLINRINGYFVQHYTSFNIITDIIDHVVAIADGSVPQVLLTSIVDIEDTLYPGTLSLGVERYYYQQIALRKTSGLFGRGWAFPFLEMSAEISNDSVILTKQRRIFNFVRTDIASVIFKNQRLPGDQISLNQSIIIYKTKSLRYMFDSQTYRLVDVHDNNSPAFVRLGYDADAKPVSLNHNSGSNISIDYNSNGFISSVQLYRGGRQISQMYYSYKPRSIGGKFNLFDQT